MRKSGWAAATGLGALVLLLTACGGSSGSASAAGGGAGASSTAMASNGSSGSAGPATSVSAASTATKSGGSTPTSSPGAVRHSVGPQPSSGTVSFPPVGTTVMVIEHTKLGFVLAQANGQVVYTYSKDKKGGTPTCTGTCAATWIPATGTPQAGPADVFPGQFGLVTRSDGSKQITYNGYPLYLLKGAQPLTTTGNGMDGVWHVVPLSASNIR